MEAQFPDVRSMVAALKPSYPVYCLRPHVLRRNAQKFLELFPGRVLYAVKCNPHPSVLRAPRPTREPYLCDLCVLCGESFFAEAALCWAWAPSLISR